MNNWNHPYSNEIKLYVEGRIAREDALRQEKTAVEILRRLETQPGIILADEVGMGKTFVALAVAVSVALSDEERRPAVVMVPPSLKYKWPRDFSLFSEKCIPADIRNKIKCASAEKAVDFLKFLDDPLDRRNSIIFLTHGAMHRGLTDGWTKAAIIYRALYARKNTDNLKRVLGRFMGRLLYMQWAERKDEDIWGKLLTHHPSDWLKILQRSRIDAENDDDPVTDDDPVPQAILDVLWDLDATRVFEALQEIPYKETKHFEDHLENARYEINVEIKKLWAECIRRLKLKLPLLILDEAHHLKNARTRLASLFQVEDAKDDAEEISRGPLGGIFERMLFLTATPFQLGHHELCSVLERFQGIYWGNGESASADKNAFTATIVDLLSRLDAAQGSSLRLGDAWDILKEEDLTVDGQKSDNTSTWWQQLNQTSQLSDNGRTVVSRYEQAKENMKSAEDYLKPWVIRHLKPRCLPETKERGKIFRRENFVGNAINNDKPGPDSPGICVESGSVLPFLLAARASVCNPDSRPVFAEGLASSYQAFMHTRKMNLDQNKNDENNATDTDDEAVDLSETDQEAEWYLNKLQETIPLDDEDALSGHPKISATINKTLDLWKKGEKVLIFCHYIATGRTLRQLISSRVQKEIMKMAISKLQCREEEAAKVLERIGNRFEKDSPVQRKTIKEIEHIIERYPELGSVKEKIINVVLRYLRTQTFLVRYFPIEEQDISEDSVDKLFQSTDVSGLTFCRILDDFMRFLSDRCGESERHMYLDALENIQTGTHYGADVQKTFGEDEIQGDRSGLFIANVRLVNGQAKQETRQKLMLTFNTPFYPEILIASSVMAEGVDLHLNCRYVIHHDLCWNPSSLEQRTGRVDRIGAKCERSGLPISIYLPFIAETQDEKMYRVVTDRERWFKIVMGEEFKVTYKSAEKRAQRLPLPEELANELSFRLEVTGNS